MSFRDLPGMTAAEVWAELKQITSIDQQGWLDILSLPPDQQKLVLQTYAHMDWTQPGTPFATRVIAILTVLGTVAGVVTGVAGAATGVAGVVQLLK
jgi:hypothetical protein